MIYPYVLSNIKRELFTNKATNKANYFITYMNTYYCSEVEKIIIHTWARICSLLRLLFAKWSEITLFKIHLFFW